MSKRIQTTVQGRQRISWDKSGIFFYLEALASEIKVNSIEEIKRFINGPW
jgi:hypothetical protein